jgi:glycosyltransferase involved in cell wall biosynthesis
MRLMSVAMITMNEELAVGIVIHKIKAVLPEAEIVIVDSSDDKTAEIAESLGARVLRQYPPRGYGNAMMMALAACEGEVIMTLDCDDTYPVDVLPSFASLIIEQGYDLVDGSRLRKKPKAMPWLNYLANRFFASLASLLFAHPLSDLHSGMRAYRKSMLQALSFEAEGAALPVELLLKPLLRGYKVHVQFIDYRQRIGTSTLRPLSSAWWTLKRMLKLRVSV